MTDTIDTRSPSRWPFLVVLAALAILGVVWLASPSGDRDGAVDDPIVTQDFGEQAMQVETMQQDNSEPMAE